MTTTNPQKPKLVTRVCLVDTFRSIRTGESATFDCREVGSYASAKSCISRLNSSGSEFTIVTPDNGVTYTITRIK